MRLVRDGPGGRFRIRTLRERARTRSLNIRLRQSQYDTEIVS